eukprot:COSAG05_NODE_3708_length_1891_cov_2.995477_2_plen_152_part_01
MKRAMNASGAFGELVAARPVVVAPAEGIKRLEAGDPVPGHVHGVRYSLDMRTFFVAADRKRLQAIDVQTSTVTEPAMHPVDGGLCCLDFNADETRACTNGMVNGMVRMYDTTDRSAWVQKWEHSAGGGFGLSLWFSCDGKRVFTANLKKDHL